MNASPVARALCGGAGLLCVSIIWSVFLPQNGDLFLRLIFSWLSSAWVVFPVGTALPWALPRYVAQRKYPAGFGTGVLAGMAAGLVITAGVWVWFNHQGLIGLIANRNSGGYASYSYSIRGQLSESARRLIVTIIPVVTAWAVWITLSKKNRVNLDVEATEGRAVLLRLNRRVALRFVFALIGFGIFATTGLLAAALTSRNVHVPIQSFLLVGPAAVGLVILGPWLGPLINPTGNCQTAWQLTAVALPVLLLGFAPFVLKPKQQPVKISAAVIAWCGLITALLFWMGVGVLSLGWSLG